MIIKAGTVLTSAVAIGLSAVFFTAVIGAEPATLIREKGPYVSQTPQYRFADTLKEQEAQLKNNPLMKRFAASRQAQAADPYRPAYHFVNPEGGMLDVLELLYWQDNWHLFYAAYPPEGKHPQHWGHAISKDMVNWRDLPYAIYPGVEQGSFDGGIVVEKGRVAAFYTGFGAPGVKIPWRSKYLSDRGIDSIGMMTGVSSDPLLLNWEKSGPLKTITTLARDADIWKEGDTYFGLVGPRYEYYPESTAPRIFFGPPMHGAPASWPKSSLWSSKDLKIWKPEGELLFEKTPFSDRYDDLSCPTFIKINDRHLLLYISHVYGSRYFLGDYDEKTNKFRPYDHGKFNHGEAFLGGALCAGASEDGAGGVINIMNVTATKLGTHLMALPQRLTLGDDKRLRIAPLEALSKLRGQHKSVKEMALPNDQEFILQGIEGNTMELALEIDPGQTRYVELNVLRSPEAEEQTSITFYNLHTPDGLYGGGRFHETVVLDTSRSSTLPDVATRSPEKVSINIGNENVKLRIFIDRSIVEVFVNGKQYLVGRAYPGRKDSLGVSLRAYGQGAVLKKLDAWQMKAIWPVAASQSVKIKGQP